MSNDKTKQNEDTLKILHNDLKNLYYELSSLKVQNSQYVLMGLSAIKASGQGVKKRAVRSYLFGNFTS